MAGDEKGEVVVSLKVGLFLSDGNTISSPDLSRSLKGGKDINSASGSGRSSRCGGGRSSGSRGTSVTHLQVFLERRGNRDTLARIFVIEGIGVTGIGHTSSSEGRSVEESGGDTGLLRGGEGRSSSNEGGNKGNFANGHHCGIVLMLLLKLE